MADENPHPVVQYLNEQPEPANEAPAQAPVQEPVQQEQQAPPLEPPRADNPTGELEERASNKLELTGPLIDSYFRELWKAMYAKLGRSRNTGLMPPVKLFVPYTMFQHLCNVAVGYGGSMKSSKTTLAVNIESFEAASKVFSPVRFGGQNYFIKKRLLDKVRVNSRTILQYSGRASVVVGKSTPVIFDYNMKQEKLTLTFYVQRYDKADFCLDLRLQALMNKD
ncbi:Hypothetical predicted protein [Paramuricea clavata]|uniref:Uncharacterized protein n=1 Tax=Paramuricea clavata TaxID=317549 RepID=A0A7D9J620_PARCT|nr:Hypothetical predicted protein [Paramuricea clavata]